MRITKIKNYQEKRFNIINKSKKNDTVKKKSFTLIES